MNVAVVFTVFPLIFVGELPDKTMFASLVMASRGRPFTVWLGTVVGFAVHVVIAVSVGVAVFKLLPPRVVDIVVAVMFAAGSVYAWRERNDEEADAEVTAGGTGLRTAATAAGVIFLAEWGDLTQILTANLAARYHDVLAVGVGSLAGLVAVSGLAALTGQSLLRFVPVRGLRIAIAAILLVLTVLSAVRVL